MLVTSCSSIHTKTHFGKHVIITTIIKYTRSNCDGISSSHGIHDKLSTTTYSEVRWQLTIFSSDSTKLQLLQLMVKNLKEQLPLTSKSVEHEIDWCNNASLIKSHLFFSSFPIASAAYKFHIWHFSAYIFLIKLFLSAMWKWYRLQRNC